LINYKQYRNLILLLQTQFQYLWICYLTGLTKD